MWDGLNVDIPAGEEFNRRWAVYEVFNGKSKSRRTKRTRPAK